MKKLELSWGALWGVPGSPGLAKALTRKEGRKCGRWEGKRQARGHK